MLASLLPGLRDLRTPLATGYLWLILLWLLLHDYLPKSTEGATGPIRSLYELGGLLGSAAVIAALSFVAYLLGSMLIFIPDSSNFFKLRQRNAMRGGLLQGRLARLSRLVWIAFISITRAVGGDRLASQMATFAGKRLREISPNLTWHDHLTVLADNDLSREEEFLDQMEQVAHFPTSGPISIDPDEVVGGEFTLLWALYANQMFDDMPAIAIQLQAKNRDLWDTYDRLRAEAEFRFGITPPLALLVLLMAIQSGAFWWIFLLAAPIYLLILAVRHSVLAASTLVQAVVLRIVETPVLERLAVSVANIAQRNAETGARADDARAGEEAPTDRE